MKAKRSPLINRALVMATYRRNLKLYEAQGETQKAEIQRRLIKRLGAE